MNKFIKVLLAPIAVMLTRRLGAKVTLDVSLFLNRMSFKPLKNVESLLSSMDVEDLSNEDVRRLAAFAGTHPSVFLKEYCMVQK